MRVFEEKGTVVSNGSRIVIDPSRKPGCPAVVSHAHSDHAGFSMKEAELLLSRQTLGLLSEKLSKGNAKAKGLEFGKKTSFGGFEVSLHSSCHILGSSQVLVEGSKTVGITTDFQLQESLFLPRAEPMKCDVLVIESTFGLPTFDFPRREQVYSQIGEWVEGNSKRGVLSVLCGYALGKAQELTKIVNEYSNQVPVVHEKIFEFNEKHRVMGAKLGEYKKPGSLKEETVLILPPSLVEKNLLNALSLSSGKKVESAMATGWGHSGRFDRAFPLSDHADYKQLMRYVSEAEPKMVFTEHGYARELARRITRKTGIPARPLSEKGQKAIQEYV